MTSITTAAAATQAGVTIATIRTWCRRGAISAIKRAGRWVIDQISLTHRIAIGTMRARKTKVMTTTGTIVQLHNGSYGICGDENDLAAAYETGTPIAPTNGPYAQDRVYLGSTRETYSDYGRSLETLGLAYQKENGQAVYYIDMARLKDAPAFSAELQKTWEDAMAQEAAMARRDNEYLNPRYM